MLQILGHEWRQGVTEQRFEAAELVDDSLWKAQSVLLGVHPDLVGGRQHRSSAEPRAIEWTVQIGRAHV